MSGQLAGVPLAPKDYQVTQSHPLITATTRGACARTWAKEPTAFWHRMSMVLAQSEIASAWEMALKPYFYAREPGANQMRASGQAIHLADKIAQTFFEHNWHAVGAPACCESLTPEEQAIVDDLQETVVCTGFVRR